MWTHPPTHMYQQLAQPTATQMYDLDDNTYSTSMTSNAASYSSDTVPLTL